MDAIEGPARNRIQEVLNQTDVEAIIKNKLPEFEQLGFNMSMADFKF